MACGEGKKLDSSTGTCVWGMSSRVREYVVYNSADCIEGFTGPNCDVPGNSVKVWEISLIDDLSMHHAVHRQLVLLEPQLLCVQLWLRRSVLRGIRFVVMVLVVVMMILMMMVVMMVMMVMMTTIKYSHHLTPCSLPPSMRQWCLHRSQPVHVRRWLHG
jgi:hypothetical protein